MALADPNNPDPQHVWGKEPTPPADRQMSDIPNEQFQTYHEDNLCDDVPPGLVRIHRTVARERDLRPCSVCVEAGDDTADGDSDGDGGVLAGLL